MTKQKFINFLVVFITAITVFTSSFYYFNKRLGRFNKEKILQIKSSQELEEVISGFIDKNTNIAKRYSVQSLFLDFTLCQLFKKNDYPKVILDMVKNDDLLFIQLLLDEYNRWPTSIICPNVLTMACRANTVFQSYNIPESFCNEVCQKLQEYDQNKQKIIDDLVLNDFKGWRSRNRLPFQWFFRIMIVSRYNERGLVDQICNSLDREKNSQCVTFNMRRKINREDYKTGSDFIKRTPSNINNITELYYKTLLKRDTLFYRILPNKSGHYSTDKICPVVLLRECRYNKVRQAYIPESFCNEVCQKLQEYDQDRQKLMEEVIFNDFKNWENGDSLSVWPFLRSALAYRYGGPELVRKICDYKPLMNNRSKCFFWTQNFLDRLKIFKQWQTNVDSCDSVILKEIANKFNES